MRSLLLKRFRRRWWFATCCNDFFFQKMKVIIIDTYHVVIKHCHLARLYCTFTSAASVGILSIVFLSNRVSIRVSVSLFIYSKRQNELDKRKVRAYSLSLSLYIYIYRGSFCWHFVNCIFEQLSQYSSIRLSFYLFKDKWIREKYVHIIYIYINIYW